MPASKMGGMMPEPGEGYEEALRNQAELEYPSVFVKLRVKNRAEKEAAVKKERIRCAQKLEIKRDELITGSQEGVVTTQLILLALIAQIKEGG